MEQDVRRKPKWNWMKTAGLALVALLALVLAKGIGTFIGRLTTDRFSAGYQEAATDNAIKTGLAQAVAQLRTQVPIHVDEITILRDAFSTEREIIYITELNADLESAHVAEVRTQLEQQNARNVCADSSMRKLIEAGGIMTWQYTVNSGERFKVSVSKCS